MLRHGRSEWNARRRWQGRFDSPLDDVGRAQARAAARELARIDRAWDQPVASSLRRASETAAIVAETLGLDPPRLDERLVEADAGEWQGMTPDQIEDAYPGWLTEHRRPASFEPFESVVSRATNALLDTAGNAAEHPGTTALVVSHSGVIRSVIRSLGMADTRIPNLGGVWLGVSATDRHALRFDGVFDPHGVVVSGVDTPGEDPGEQPDQPDQHGRPDR